MADQLEFRLLTMSEEEPTLESMRQRRGYLMPFHTLLAEHDPEFLASYDALVETALLQSRALDRRTKELVLVGILTAISAPRSHLDTHIRAAKNAGASDKEILEALELVMPSAGVARFMEGVETWSQVIGVDSAATAEPESGP
jgi:4-carboxymuconolactone decarboxylase